MNLIKIFQIVFVFIVLILGCGDNSTNPTTTNLFTIKFENNYIRDGGWAILHNLEGTEIVKAIEVTGNELVDFGEIDSSHITCTIIYTYRFWGRNYTNINSYVNVVGGNWVVKGNNISNRGIASLNLTYNSGSNDRWVVSCPQGFAGGSSAPPAEINLEVYHLDEKNLFTGFAAVFENNASNGFCGWILNQSFFEGDTNSYSINLNTQMEAKNIATSSPVDRLTIDALKKDIYYSYRQFTWYDSHNPQTSINAYYSSQFPSDKFGITAYRDTNNIQYYYTQTINTIPNFLNIPEYSVTGNYNINQDQIENISVSGNADRIDGNWYYRNDSTRISWDVKVPVSIANIRRPILSQEVIDDLGVELALLEINRIEILDYDSVTNFDEYVIKFFKSNMSFFNVYNSIYRYSLRF